MSKLERAKSVVERYNVAAEKKVDWDAFVKKLEGLGGVTDEVLAECSWDDLEACGLPKLLAKAVATAFRTSEKPAAVVVGPVISEARASNLTPLQLFQAYDPRKPTSPVAREIKNRATDRLCVAFKPGTNVVDVEKSAQLLQELVDGFDARTTVEIDDRPCKVYRVGELPDELVDENPLYRGEKLRNGECDNTGESWNGISDEVRVLLHLAVSIHETSVEFPDDARNLIAFARGATASVVRLRYKKASVLYDELKNQGKLPTLKIKKSGNGGSHGRPNDPFGTHTSY